MSEPTLNDLAAIESEVLANVQGVLGDLASLPDEVNEVYKELGRAFCLTGGGTLTDYQVIGFMYLLGLMGHQTLMGSLTLMRGHPTDSTNYSRKAIESAAFCLEILADAESAKRWMEAGKSKGAMKNYASRFAAWQVVKNRLKPVEESLSDTYEYYCLSVHPGLAAVSRQAILEDGAFQFNHLEVSNQDDHDALKAQFLLGVTNHLKIVAMLAKALEDMKFPLAANYHEKFDKVQAKVSKANTEFAEYMQAKKQNKP
jgi:hypothetical protein